MSEPSMEELVSVETTELGLAVVFRVHKDADPKDDMIVYLAGGNRVLAEAYAAKFRSALSVFGEAKAARLEAERDEARRKLFPYADATEISGMSWNGFYLIGDSKSIAEFRRVEHRAAQLEEYRRAFDERIAVEKARAERADAALREIAEYHIPDQPAAYGGDELSWAQRQHAHLRRIARAALPPAPDVAGSQP